MLQSPPPSRQWLDHLLEEVERAVSVGINSIILFGVPAEKDAVGSGAYAELQSPPPSRQWCIAARKYPHAARFFPQFLL